jgi:hypothetical protein
VIYADFLLSGMADFAENFYPKMAVFLVNSANVKPIRWMQFNRINDFNEIGNGQVNTK